MATTQELIDAVNALTTQTTEVLAEYTDAKKNIDAKVASASTNATLTAEDRVSVSTSEDIATTKASEASVSAVEAKGYRDSASEISGLTTVTEAVDLALGNIPFNAMTENARKEMIAQNNEKYAASGFVHFGKHYNAASSSDVINEGLWTLRETTSSNSLFIGRDVYLPIGDSKTSYPLVNIAGILSKLDRCNDVNLYESHIKFPEAPNGTVTYDSATGVITDFMEDPAPQYVGIAGYETLAERAALAGTTELQEAVASAFGDLLRFEVLPTGDANYDPSTSVISFNATGTNGISFYHGVSLGEQTIKLTVSANEDVTLKLQESSSTTGASSVIIDIPLTANKITTIEIDYTFESDAGIYFRTVNNTVSLEYTLHTLTINTPTVEVVTERVDMFGLEQFEEQITEENPQISPNGLVQSMATSMSGITCTSGTRPDTYYAVFDGDDAVASDFSELRWFDLTAEQQATIAADPDNKITFWANGDITQTKIRQRTIAGAGNGDWKDIGSETSAAIQFGANTLSAQGHKDVTLSDTSYNSQFGYYGAGSDYITDRGLGIFKASSIRDGMFSAKNECYFLVMGTVPRLNQGAYHPSLNPMGTRSFVKSGLSWDNLWSDLDYAITRKDLFYAVTSSGDLSYYRVGDASGDIESGYSGRPDGRFYDAIYAGGQGGVIDYRLSAWDASSAEKAAEVDAMVKNGTYRGKEKLKFTKFSSSTVTVSSLAKYNPTNSSGTILFDVSAASNGLDVSVPELDNPNNTHWLIWGDNGNAMRVPIVWGSAQHYVYFPYISNAAYFYGSGDVADEFNEKFPVGTVISIGHEYETNISVSGEFTMCDIIGDPANILQCDALKDGWYGSWVPIIPDGTNKSYPANRKALSFYTDSTYTLNNGDSWQRGATGITEVTNDFNSGGWGPASTLIEIKYYTAYAKQTEATDNAVVLHGEAGLGSVWASTYYQFKYGGAFIESILGSIPTSQSSDIQFSTLNLNKTSIYDGLIAPTNSKYWSTHQLVDLVAPSNNSPAVKALMYQTESNNQASLNYAYNELVYDGDWGDDSTIKISDNDSTALDDNGNTIAIGTHTLSLPYGWVKNNI